MVVIAAMIRRAAEGGVDAAVQAIDFVRGNDSYASSHNLHEKIWRRVEVAPKTWTQPRSGAWAGHRSATFPGVANGRTGWRR